MVICSDSPIILHMSFLKPIRVKYKITLLFMDFAEMFASFSCLILDFSLALALTFFDNDTHKYNYLSIFITLFILYVFYCGFVKFIEDIV